MGFLKRYLIPACITLVLGGTLWFVLPNREPAEPIKRLAEDSPKEISLPHGRVLYVVVEEQGVCIGEVMVPFVAFEEFLRANLQVLRPDYANVAGTDLARYEDIFRTYGLVKKVFEVPVELDTQSLPVGTRRDPIETHDHRWEYKYH